MTNNYLKQHLGRPLLIVSIAMLLATITLVLVSPKPGQAQDSAAWPVGNFVYSAWDGDTNEIIKKEYNSTSSDTKLTLGGSVNYYDPALSPWGTKVAFNGCPKPYNEPCHIYTTPFNTVGGTPTQLTNSGSDRHPTWSPDGSWIAYEHRDNNGIEIYMIKASGGTPVKVTSSGNNHNPTWSPDGKWIAYEHWNGRSYDIYKISPPPLDERAVSVDGAEVRVTTDTPTSAPNDYDPDWSPKGDQISFDRGDSVYVAPSNPNDPSVSPSLVGRGQRPAWSPDGSRIAFLYPTAPDGGCLDLCAVAGTVWDIYTANPDGSGSFRITGGGNITSERENKHSMDWGWLPDTKPPEILCCSKAFTWSSTLSTSAVPVSLSWLASDNTAGSNGMGSSGISRSFLERSTNGGAYTLDGAPYDTKWYVRLEPGNTYSYRVRAVDKAGNWSAWTYRESFKLEGHQETSATYSGSWHEDSFRDAYGGSVKHAKASGAVARFSFTGQDVAWVSTTGPDRGKAEVRIDGRLISTVDLYSATTQARKIVAIYGEWWKGFHTVEVKVLGTKAPASSGTRVDVDAFTVM
jgi:WD40-like Beta Propeller Repeat